MPTRVKEKSDEFRGFAPSGAVLVSAPAGTRPAAAARLVLASGSPYRAELLRRLSDDFDVRPARVDERARPAEQPAELASRLSQAKAEAAVPRRGVAAAPAEIIIGSDQVADLDGSILGKPRTFDANVAMLERCSGRTVRFFTAVCVICTDGGATQSHIDTTEVHFRSLARDDIEAYVTRDQALDCAGGFKLEKAGITLFNKVITEDPTAIIGLPLIWLAGALRRAGWRLSGGH